MGKYNLYTAFRSLGGADYVKGNTTSRFEGNHAEAGSVLSAPGSNVSIGLRIESDKSSTKYADNLAKVDDEEFTVSLAPTLKAGDLVIGIMAAHTGYKHEAGYPSYLEQSNGLTVESNSVEKSSYEMTSVTVGIRQELAGGLKLGGSYTPSVKRKYKTKVEVRPIEDSYNLQSTDILRYENGNVTYSPEKLTVGVGVPIGNSTEVSASGRREFPDLIEDDISYDGRNIISVAASTSLNQWTPRVGYSDYNAPDSRGHTLAVGTDVAVSDVVIGLDLRTIDYVDYSPDSNDVKFLARSASLSLMGTF